MKKKYFIYIILVLLLTSCKYTKYDVSFYDGENLLASTKVLSGAKLENVDIPKKDGYIFVSWQKDGYDYSLENPVTEDTVLIANWVEEPNLPNNHKVIFNFGDYTKDQTVKDGEKVPVPEIEPSKEKHKFLGWYVGDSLFDFETPITKDILIVAKFEKNRITITYDLNGGSGSTVKTEINVGSTPDKPEDPSKFGYTFAYWTIDGEKYYFDKDLEKDTTIKANYTAKTYHKVTFDTDGGNVIPSQMVASGDTIEVLPAAEKEGYIFKYWSYSDKAYDVSTKIDKDITLLAIYEKIEVPEPSLPEPSTSSEED
jgi:hypothetical protein